MALVLGPILAVPSGAVPADDGDEEGPRLFREKVEPVLAARCYACHSAEVEKVKGGLRLDSREGLLQGGDSGPAAVAGNSGESLMVQAIRHEDGLAMPPKGPKLDDAEIADIVRWIDLGLPAPAGKVGGGTSIDEQARSHWSFQPVRKAAPPEVRDPSWMRTPIDRFILAALESRGWRPSPPATRAGWVRRLIFDLTGLPPTPEEVAEYEADTRPDADERLVDRILASPHYGERWAQHWLDVVRFAETEGFEYDRHIPDAWRFRDYVIDSLNRDKPFDRFVIEQIAGDEIGPDDPECLTASAFHRLGPVRRNAGNPEIALSRNEVLTERTDIVGAAFLGMTVGCARCHNHKLEPISQKDYYRLQAYMAATDEHDVSLAPEAERAEWEATTKRLQAEIAKIKKVARLASGAEKARMDMRIEQLEDQLPPPPATIPATWNKPDGSTLIHVLKRGVWEAKGEPVGPRPPGILVSDDTPELPADATAPRTQLARWLTSPGHPLTPRVIVNRLWAHHFGTGLVASVNDFGLKGERPSHPELLDWLASMLVEGGWRLKPIHRQILLSSTYRQSSRPTSPPSDEAAEADPSARLLWKFPGRRLSAEEVRDAMLAASGRLNPEMGGPSVMLPVDPDLVRLLYKPAQWQVARDPAEHDRRSAYLIAKRNLRLPFLEAFDAPALTTSCARRESSTHAPQALEMLNGRLSNDLAAAFSRRLAREAGDSPEAVVDLAFRLALGRSPTAEERALSLDFLHEGSIEEFALAVFNLNGFFYVP